VRIVTVTQFQLADSDYSALLGQLSSRSAQREARFPDSTYAYSMGIGATDLVQTAVLSHASLLGEYPQCSRRFDSQSVGAIAPSAPVLDDLDERAVPIEDILKPDDRWPFIAHIYLKASVVAGAARPRDGRPHFSMELLSRLFAKESALWQHLAAVTQATLPASASDELKLSPLIGLDTFELVVIARARRLEHLASVSCCLRNQSLRDYWPAADEDDALRELSSVIGFTGNTRHDQIRAPEWDASPVFMGSSTVVGMPVHRRVPAYGYELPAPGPPGTLAVGRAAWLSRRLLLPRFATEAQAGDQTPTGEEPRQRGAGEEADGKRFQLLFGRMDVVATPESGRLPPGLKMTAMPMGQLHRYLRGLLRSSEGEGMRTSTELIVETLVPTAIAANLPTGGLLTMVRCQLQARAEGDLLRSNPQGLVRRWLDAARETALSYAHTNAGTNLIGRLLAASSKDEMFLDVLIALDTLLGTVHASDSESSMDSSKPERRAQLLWVRRNIADAMLALQRHDHPMRSPGRDYGGAGYIGDRMQTLAFTSYCFHLARALRLDPPVLLTEAVVCGTVAEPGPLAGVVIRASPLRAQTPIVSWIAGPVADAALDRRHLEDEDAAQDLAELVAQPLSGPATLGALLDQAKHSLELVESDDQAQPLRVAAAASTRGLLTDLVQRQLVTRTGEQRAATNARFLFQFGPAIIREFEDRPLGVHRDQALEALVVRVFLLDYVLCDGEAADWLVNFTRWLTICAQRDWDGAEVGAEDDAMMQILAALHVDLAVPTVVWQVAIRRLLDGVADALDGDPVEEIVAALIRLAQEPWELGPKDPLDPLVDYIDSQMAAWPRARPWLRHCEGSQPAHPDEQSDRYRPGDPVLSRRGAIFASGEDQVRHLGSTLDLMLRMAEDARQRRRSSMATYLHPD